MQRHPLPTYQLKPDYPVLAPLSRSYPKSKGRLPTRYSPVRHSTQGRSPFLVRLACVRHAASVHSEPESNSPVMYNCRATLLLFINLIKSEFYLLQLAIYLSKILAFPARGKRLYRPSFSPSSFFLSFFNSPSRSALRKGRRRTSRCAPSLQRRKRLLCVRPRSVNTKFKNYFIFLFSDH